MEEGRVPLRASTGAWKASLFVVAIEFSERLSYFGIATNLIIYLTKVIHQDLKTAAKSVNYWSGVTTLMPLLGGFLADAYFGRFSMILISSIVYLMGLSLLTMSEMIPSLKPCDTDSCQNPKKLHEVVFFLALYLISFGTAGHKPCLESFGADQFDDDHTEERRKKMSYFNWWNFALCAGILLGVTVIVYVQDDVSWAIADIVLTSVMAISIVVFLMGRRFYRYRLPEGSPLTPMLQVLVAAIAKRNLPLPSNPGLLYEVPKSQNTRAGRLLCHTSKLSFLDKAAILEEEGDKEDQGSIMKQQSPWRLATVTKVEELKLVLNLVPIWFSTLTFGLCVAQGSTFFIKQGATMNRKIGSNGFEIPPASIFSLAAVGMIITVTVYDRILVPLLRRLTGNERGINILQRIGIGMVFSSLTMIIAALVERKRLGVAEREIIQGGGKGAISMSVFWLAPQFLIIGIGDGFTLVGLQEYFYDQVPDSMRSLGIAFYLSVLGASNFLSSFMITVIDDLTQSGGRNSWFGKDLNHSRLDKFYWLLAGMNALNLCVYMFIARRYSYKNVLRRVAVADCSNERDGLELVMA
ncbi:Proton-dependent oligopeptide transporter family [Macleaya cordata]|uniref:Proton-dependent oligopeptide transporter family n=1 Tax=Macleaya cordata TaxID=56857 RepID=A0A200R4Z1_MACCD|nr:Proton-dependent oligopeptide transporter family [Macleaya cordata]